MNGQPQRELELQVAFSALKLCAPQLGPKRKQEPIAGWVVRCWAEGEKDLEWVLFTTAPVLNKEQALQIIEWYEF